MFLDIQNPMYEKFPRDISDPIRNQTLNFSDSRTMLKIDSYLEKKILTADLDSFSNKILIMVYKQDL